MKPCQLSLWGLPHPHFIPAQSSPREEKEFGEFLFVLLLCVCVCACVFGKGVCCARSIPYVYLMYFSFCLLPTRPPQERLLWLIDLMEVPSFLPSGAVGIL